jgi:uncharacterized membrane protein
LPQPKDVISRLTHQRIGLVDALRASAILLMVVFHFCYDLRHFGYVDWNVPNGPGWWQFRYLILTLFLGTVGISLSLAHGKGINWPKFGIRQLQIGLAAAAITLVSLWMFRQSWIYFGVLHFIFLASLLFILLVPRPRVALVIGLAVLILYWLDLLDKIWPFGYFSAHLPSYTEDYVPLFPWTGVVLVGLWLGSVMASGLWRPPVIRLPRWLRFASAHSLAIYLLHQPILFALFELISKYH